MSIVYLILAVGIIFFYYIKYRDILQPNMIFLAVWFLSAAVSSPDVSPYLNKWSYQMHLIVLLSGISFWFGTFTVLGKYKLNRSNILRKTQNISALYNRLVVVLFIICISAAILEWINGGAKFSFLELGNIEGTDVKSEIDGSIPGVHYATIFLPFVSIFSFYSLMNTNKYRITNIIIIISSIFCSFVFNLSRGDLLIFILSFVFIYSRYKIFSIKKVIFISLLIVGMFLGIMVLRVNKETLVFMMTDNPYFSVFYSYVAPCYANLNDLVNSELDYMPYGNATFAPIWTILGIKEDLPVTTIDQLGVFNARTYLYGFYHDYKYFGIIIFPYIIGYLVSKIYVGTRLKSAYWIILLAALQKAVMNGFFGNYFFGEMVILFPYLMITSVIIFLMLNENKIVIAK